MSEKKPEAQRISAVPPFGLRMLPDLRRRLEEAAAANGQSLNAEINLRLENSFSMSTEDIAITRKDGVVFNIPREAVVGILTSMLEAVAEDTPGIKWNTVQIPDE